MATTMLSSDEPFRTMAPVGCTAYMYSVASDNQNLPYSTARIFFIQCVPASVSIMSRILIGSQYTFVLSSSSNRQVFLC